MLANNNKSVAVGGGHIPSYYSNRWAILTGLRVSVHLSVLSVPRLSSSTPVLPPHSSPTVVFLFIYNVWPELRRIALVLQPRPPTSSFCFLFFTPTFLIPDCKITPVQ